MISTLQVLVLAWPGMDLLDFSGPIGALSLAQSDGEHFFQTTTAAAEPSTPTFQGVKINRDIAISDVLAQLHLYDILIVPGGGGIQAKQVHEHHAVVKAIQSFVALPPPEAQSRRPILLSICSGALFLSELGLLTGKVATTHFRRLRDLNESCATSGGSTIVNKHYVDGGLLSNDIRLITSGGITSGIDAALYVVELQCGLHVAEATRAMLDTTWRREPLPSGAF